MPPSFDERAAQWDSNPLMLALAERAAEAIARTIDPQPSMRAMEFGCGTGTLSFLLRDRVKQIVLCDTSSGMLGVTSKKITDFGLDASMSVLQSDLENGPLPEGRFDLIYTSLALHHVPNTQALLQRFADLLQPAGRLALIDLLEEDGSFHNDPSIPHNGFATEKLGKLLESLGFHVDSCEILDEIQRESGRCYPRFILTARRTTS